MIDDRTRVSDMDEKQLKKELAGRVLVGTDILPHVLSWSDLLALHRYVSALTHTYDPVDSEVARETGREIELRLAIIRDAFRSD